MNKFLPFQIFKKNNLQLILYQRKTKEISFMVT